MKNSLLFLLMICGSLANAQDWQWGRRAGGDVDSPISGSPFYTYLRDMGTDKWGNTYQVGSTVNDLSITGTNQSFPYYGALDAYIIKYDRCGNFKWAALWGGGSVDEATQIAIDDSGFIYVAGFIATDGISAHIYQGPNKDTVVTHIGMFYAKYDGDGNMIWMTTGPANLYWFPSTRGLVHLKNGNLVSVLFADQPGTFHGFSVTSQIAYIMFEFDRNGQFIKGQVIDTTNGGGSVNRIVKDDNDNIYLPINTSDFAQGGPATISYFGQPITIPAFGNMLAKVDKNLNLVKYKFGINNSAMLNLSYSDNYLYTGGLIASQASYDYDTVPVVHSPNATFTAYKIDTNLNLVWVSRPSYYQYDAGDDLVVTTTKDYVFGATALIGKTVWGHDSITTPPSTKYFAFVGLNKTDGTCAFFKADSGSSSYFNRVYAITSDRQGSVQIGGTFQDNFSVANDVLVPSSGVQSPDIYLMKWGLDCSDTLNTIDKPVSPDQLVATGAGLHTIQVQWADASPYKVSYHIYRSPDGVGNWQMIDTVSNTQTTYTDQGLAANTVYWYKVAAWNTAGESSFTNIDSAQTSTLTDVEEVASSFMRLYPNPAIDQLNIELSTDKDQEVQVTISDLTGKQLVTESYQVMNGVNTRTININQLTAGYYNVTMNVNGYSSTKRIIKF